MPIVIADRVKVTTTTTGTGTLTLGTAVTGFQDFGVIGDGNQTYYTISVPGGADYEVGIGTFTASGTTLSRDTILASSNGGSVVNLSAGTKDVFVTYPAEKAVYFNAADQVDVDNLRLDGNTLSSTNTDGNVVLDPNGTGSVDVSSAKIINVDTPTSNNDAVNKTYVDSIVAAGVHYHTPVRVESPINLTATYNNGTAGVGATLTNSGAQAALVVDGVTVNVADRVLIYEQTDQTQNGIYTVTDVGSGATNWVLTRATDADTYGVAGSDVLGEGSAVFVQEGSTGAGETYVCNTTGTITFGTTNITFVQISSAQIYSAGAGLDLTGTQFSVETNGITDAMLRQSAGLSVVGRSANTTGDVADVAAANDGQVLRRSGTSIGFGAVNLASTDAVTGILPVANGGTGQSSYVNGELLIGNTTGNTLTKATITGTADRLLVTNGAGSITLNVDATNVNTANKVVARDASGNFSAGTITAALSGNATTATTLQTARTIQGVSFNGAANITVVTASTGVTVAGTAVSIGQAVATGSNVQFNSLGVGTGASGTTGEIRATNNVTAFYSDARLKEIVGPIDNALEKVSKISGIYYTQNKLAESFGYDNYEQQVGVIAQEIKEVLPEAVKFAPFDREIKDGKEISKSGEEYLTVQYDKLVPLLIEAIKELRAEIKLLKG